MIDHRIVELLKQTRLRYSRSVLQINRSIKSIDVIAQLHNSNYLKDRDAYECAYIDAIYPGSALARAISILTANSNFEFNAHKMRSHVGMITRTLDDVYVGSDRKFAEDVFVSCFRSGGSLQITTHDQNIPILTELNSCNFEIVVVESPRPQSIDPTVVVYDGCIETVSEANRILNFATETKHPVHIFATRYSPDVVSTVKFNNKSKRMSVWLYEYEKDVENVNTPKDVGICVGCAPITAAEGRTLNVIPTSEYVRVEKIIVGESKVSIVNDRTKSHRAEFVENLMSSRRAADNEYSASALEKRIRRLVSSGVELRIAETDPFRSEFAQLSREFNSMYAHGFVENAENPFFSRQCIPYAAYVAVKDAISQSNDVFYLS